MNVMEKMAMTDESTTLTIEENTELSDSMSIICLSADASASERENVLSGTAKNSCRYPCAWAIGSSILCTTAAKSRFDSW